ncbi:MAG: hypothetical protein M1269_03265 [Chloroflexi bacterium]|nr:hypothetical protein [Chloroflexota bacterium]
MKKLIMWLLFAAIVIGAVLPAAAASDEDIYIRNRLYTGETAVINGEFYLPLENALAAMGFGWTVKGDGIELYPEENYKGVLAVNTNSIKIIAGDLNFTIPVLQQGGYGMVSLKKLAGNLGFKYGGIPEAGIISVDQIRKIGAAPKAAAAQPTEKKTGTMAQPIKLQNEDLYEDTPPINSKEPWTLSQSSQLRGTATFVNESTNAVDNITITMVMLDGYGNNLMEVPFDSFNLGAGETKGLDVYWNNNTRMRANWQWKVQIGDGEPYTLKSLNP